MKPPRDTEAFKRLQEQADQERLKLLRAAHLLGVEQPQRRPTKDLRVAVRRRIREAQEALDG